MAIDPPSHIGLIDASSSDEARADLEIVRPRSRRPVAARVVTMLFDALIVGTAVLLQQRVTAVVYGALVLIGCIAATKTHKRFVPKVSDDAPALLVAVALPVAVTPLFGTPADVEAVAISIPFLIVGLLLGRTCSYAIVRRLRTSEHRRRRAVVVGGGESAAELLAAAKRNPRLGLDIVAYVGQPTDLPLDWAGPTSVLPRIAAVRGVDHVIVAAEEENERELARTIRECASRGVGVSVVPRLFRLGAVPPSPWVDWIWKTPVVHTPPPPQRTYAWYLKRLMDIGLSALALVLLSPLLAIVAGAVAATSRGPILFRQERVTEGGRRFELLKFRTLPVNDASDVRWDQGELQPTTVGLVLRKTGLDELPQLLNIIKGDMSLVGPRPERPFFVEQFRRGVEGYEDRMRVPAGLTGWAQIHGLRGDTSIQDRADFDNHYIEGWSLWRDVVILARTVKAFVGAQGR